MRDKYIKAAKRTTAPTRLLSFSCDTTDGATDTEIGHVPRRFESVTVAYSERRRTGWNSRHVRRFKTAGEFWIHVYQLCRDKSLLTMVSPVCMDDLTLLRVWRELDENRLRRYYPKGFRWDEWDKPAKPRKEFTGEVIQGNPPDILRVAARSGNVKALSLRNYVTTPLKDHAQQLGLNHAAPLKDEPRSLTVGWAAKDVAAVTLAVMEQLVDWWIGGDCGPWRDTTSMLAVSLFKRHFMSHKMLKHSDPEGTRIEIAACHGPRQSVWFCGDIGEHPGDVRGQQPPPDPSRHPSEPGPVIRVDVRSQYPFLMHQYPFPARLLGTWMKTSPEHLRDVLRVYGAVATVRLKTDVAEYPLKQKKRSLYPTGDYWTTLAGPELIRALDAGHVVQVGAVARYELKYLYREFAAFLWRRRCEYRAAGDSSGELWAKLIGNSFGGKLNQNRGRWVIKPGERPRYDWGIYVVTKADGSGCVTERGLAGSKEVYDKTTTGTAISRAGFAYLTAYSRLQMRDLRELLQPRDVYAQHTDCLWVNETGYEKLVQLDLIQPDELGGLKPSDPTAYSRFLSPSIRYEDGVWTASGIAEGFRVMKHCRFRTVISRNLHRHEPTAKAGQVLDVTINRNLSDIQPPSEIGSDGWAVPFHLSLEPDGLVGDGQEVDA